MPSSSKPRSSYQALAAIWLLTVTNFYNTLYNKYVSYISPSSAIPPRPLPLAIASARLHHLLLLLFFQESPCDNQPHRRQSPPSSFIPPECPPQLPSPPTGPDSSSINPPHRSTILGRFALPPRRWPGPPPPSPMAALSTPVRPRR